VLSKQRVLKESARIAFSDIRKVFKEDGSMVPIHEMPEDVAKSIAAVEIDELWAGTGADRIQIGVTKKIKFWDKNASLRTLMQFMKLLGEDDPNANKQKHAHIHIYFPDNGRQKPAPSAIGPESVHQTEPGTMIDVSPNGQVLNIPSNGR
jgi:hypothetical protein